MGGFRRHLCCGVFALTALGLTPVVVGNGFYKSMVAHPAPPAIPVQRAMILHRDGVETLIVESAFNTKSREVGWILPLPAEPTALEKADDGLLESVSTCLQPYVVAHRDPEKTVALAAMLLALAVATARVGSNFLPRWLVIVTTTLAAFFGVALLVPTLGVGPDAAARVTVTQSHRVGNYDVQVIRSSSVDALAEWLTRNKLASLTANERPVLEDYIARGWCFLVAHLVRGATGEATPHPIAATFPAAQPVFPMRATSLAGSRTLVELIVVSDQGASAPGFGCVVADRFVPGQQRIWADEIAQVSPWLESRSKLVIGHPDAVQRMWDGCVVTKLTAELEPRQMDRDVSMTLAPFKQPDRQQVFSPRARNDIVMAVLYGGSAVALVLVAIVWRKGRQRTWAERVSVPVVAAVTLPSAIGLYIGLPVIPVFEQSRIEARRPDRQQEEIVRAARRAIDQGRLDASGPITPEGLWTALERSPMQPTGELRNPYTGRPIERRRSPGDYAVLEIDGQEQLCFYDRTAREIRLPLKAAPTTRP